MSPCPDVSRHGQHGPRPVLRGKHQLRETSDAPVQLCGGGACGQREVEAVHQARFVHAGETPQGCLGLAGAGLGLDDEQLLVQRSSGGGMLDGVGGVNMGEQARKFGHPRELVPLLRHIEADVLDGSLGLLFRLHQVIVAWLTAEGEPLFVGPNPVGQGTETEEVMLELWPGRQRPPAGLPGRREPESGQLSDKPQLGEGVEAADAGPQP